MDLAAQAAGTPKIPRGVREQQVLDAASYEFGNLGYAGASLAAVAARVGVSKALVLSYFGSKENLYVSCVQRAGEGLIAAIEEVITQPLQPQQMAEQTLAAMFGTLEARPHDWNVINDRSLPAGSAGADAGAAVRRTIAEQARRGIDRLADLDLLHDPDDLAVLTEVWMSSVTAIVNWWLRHPDRSADEMAARGARVLAAATGNR